MSKTIWRHFTHYNLPPLFTSRDATTSNMSLNIPKPPKNPNEKQTLVQPKALKKTKCTDHTNYQASNYKVCSIHKMSIEFSSISKNKYKSHPYQCVLKCHIPDTSQYLYCKVYPWLNSMNYYEQEWMDRHD